MRFRRENVLVTATSTARPLEFFQQGMVTSPGRRLAEQETLLKHWRQETLFSKPVNEVAKAVVAHNDVAVPLAASGMVAVNVKGLLAKGTSDIRVRHFETQAIPHEFRWDRCYPCPGVFCQQPCEPLRLQKRRGLAYRVSR